MFRLSMSLAIALVLVMAAPESVRADTDIQRIWGRDRIATAISVSETGWNEADLAFLARSDAFPDALAGGPLAAALEAPLLLTRRDELPQSVADELLRLDVQRVVLLGGPAAISERVEAELEELAEVERIAGADRYVTAALAAQRAADHGANAGLSIEEVIVASGRSFPDALAAASLVAVEGVLPPIVLTEQDALPEASKEAVESLGVGSATIVGGTAVVGAEVAADLQALGLSVNRLSGRDRFETGAAVLAEALSRFGEGARVLTVATGQAFPDALAAGPFAAAQAGPLAITHGTEVPAALRPVLREARERFAAVRVIGGPAAISDGVVDGLRAILDDEADDPGEGSRERPFAIGTVAAVGDDWELSVRASNPDATEEILAHNEFNDPPAEGHQFFVATVRLTNTGDAAARGDGGFRLRAVGDEGVTYSTFANSCGVIPNRLEDRTVFEGGTIEGDVCWEIRSGDAESLLLFDVHQDDRAYFQLVGPAAEPTPFPTPPPPSGTEVGSRGNPHQAGATVPLPDGWEVTITDADPDATDEILAHNQFNDPPADGHQFFMARVRATYQGDDEPSRFDGSFRLRAVGEAGAIGYTTFTDSCGVIPDALPNPETYRGGTIEGNVCWEIRSPDAATLVIYDRSSGFDDPWTFLAPPRN